MKKVKTSIFWETICYIGLGLCLFGQVMVGKMYLVAQFAYLVANFSAVIRDYAIHMPIANKVKDILFTAITIALILMRLIH